MVSASRGMALIWLCHLGHCEVGEETAGDWKGAESKQQPVVLCQGVRGFGVQHWLLPERAALFPLQKHWSCSCTDHTCVGN